MNLHIIFYISQPVSLNMEDKGKLKTKPELNFTRSNSIISNWKQRKRFTYQVTGGHAVKSFAVCIISRFTFFFLP